MARSHGLLLFALLSLASPPSGAAATGSDDEARLTAAWQKLHRGQSLPPPCRHPDPVRRVTADFSTEHPGAETALGSLRFGVVLLSARHQPLASLPLECGESIAVPSEPGPEVVELAALRASGLGPNDLVLRSRQLGRCGHIGWWQLISLQGSTLKVLLTTEEEVARACGSGPHEQSHAQLTVEAPGQLRATVQGSTQTRQTDGSYSTAAPLLRRVRYRLDESGRFTAHAD